MRLACLIFGLALSAGFASAAEPPWFPVQRPASFRDWHEDTHSLQAELRRPYGEKANVVYDARAQQAAVIKEPRIRLRDVAERVPEGMRGPSYTSYFLQYGRQWPNQPLYILDEWSCYLNGLENSVDRQDDILQGRLSRAIEFEGYAQAILRAAVELDPSYDVRPLADVGAYQSHRLWNLIARWRKPAMVVKVKPLAKPKPPAKPSLASKEAAKPSAKPRPRFDYTSWRGPVMVGFSAPWCALCPAQKTVWAQLRKEGFPLYVLEKPAWTVTPPVSGLPTTILYVDGLEVRRWKGLQPYSTLRSEFDARPVAGKQTASKETVKDKETADPPLPPPPVPEPKEKNP